MWLPSKVLVLRTAKYDDERCALKFPPPNTLYHTFEIGDTFTLRELIWCLFSEYSNQVTQGIREGTWDTINTLKFRASPGDDGTEIRCVAEHRALKHRRLERKIDLTVYCEYNTSQVVTPEPPWCMTHLFQTRRGSLRCPGTWTAWWGRVTSSTWPASAWAGTRPPRWPGTGATASCSTGPPGKCGPGRGLDWHHCEGAQILI